MTHKPELEDTITKIDELSGLVEDNELSSPEEYKKAFKILESLKAYNQSYDQTRSHLEEVKFDPTMNKSKGPIVTGFVIHTKSMLEDVIDMLCLINGVKIDDIDTNEDVDNIVDSFAYGKKSYELKNIGVISQRAIDLTDDVPNYKNSFAHDWDSHINVNLVRPTSEVFDDKDEFTISFIDDI